MPFDIASDQSSSAVTKINTVSDSAQLNEKSTVAQSGGVVIGKGAKVGTTDFSKAKLGKNASVTINNGPSPDMLQGLLGNLHQPSALEPPAPASSAPVPAAAEQPTTFNQLLESAKKNPLIVGAIVLALLAAAKLFKLIK